MNVERSVPAILLLVALLVPVPGLAQAPEGDEPPAPETIEGPRPPAPPAVVNRGDSGGVTVRAVRLDRPIVIDGALDEDVYESVPPVGDFVQSLPDEGEPATERTEAWILFDDTHVYVSARVWDSAPESEWVANEMRRDTNQLRQNDTFGVVFDTYYDRRNGVMFYTNPLGAMADFAITNEGNPNSDWNPIWDVRTGRFDGGWTVEMEIPFKSLRYRPGTEQVWGLQLRRAIRRKNEWAHLTLVPRSAAGTGAMGVFRVSENATLVGLEAPPPSTNLEIKPYGIAGSRTDRTAEPPVSNDFYADAGLDVKYGITENLTADLTYNTDFAQVEVDEQQVNLTRFNLFFPEKREFFLEGRGIFDFASAGVGAGRGGGRAPTLFFSRRIGLQERQPVPILAGGRLTGKVGAFDVGALNIQTEDDDLVGAEATNFTVLRLRRDILRRSNVGVLFTGRSRSTVVEEGSNQTYGVDGTFSFYDNVNLLGYYATTRTPGLTGTEDSYRGRFSYDADRWGLQLDHLLVGEDFNPEVGFVRRSGFRQNFVSGRFSPRPSMEAVRRLVFEGSLDYLEHPGQGYLETRERGARFQAEMENSDAFEVVFTDTYERLHEPFPIASDVTIPTGDYGFRDVEIGYSLGLQRRFSGRLSVQRGSFYDGEITSAGFSQGRLEITRQLSLEPSLSFNWVELPAGDFSTHLAVTRINYSFTPRMFVSGLVQYNSNSETFSTNLRLRWEYAPGSELFVVYTEDRDTAVFDRFSRLSNRGLVVKLTGLFRP